MFKIIAIEKILKNWVSLVTHLDWIWYNEKKEDVRHDAKKLRNVLTNKHVMALLSYNLDIQTLFKELSHSFQKKHDSGNN